MVRKFLYFVALLVVLAIAALVALRVAGDRLQQIALVPTGKFEAQAALVGDAYAETGRWLAHPAFRPDTDPARWRPDGAGPAPSGTPPFAVFFVHPTSYLDRSHWNAPADDRDSRARAQTFVRGLASPFGAAREIWAPRYRQATYGAFLTDQREGRQAIEAAYADVVQAFDYFAARADPALPIVLVGHSQGARHVLQLWREHIEGTPLAGRVALIYAVGWPISLEHDLPALGLPACATPDAAGCVLSWSSFAEPADPDAWLERYRASPGFDGTPRGDGPVLCSNPLTGTPGSSAAAAANLGTLVPDAELKTGELVAGLVPARCDARGLLLIGDGPDLGPYVLPGNNYHVYDIPLFWRNVEADVARRMAGWAAAH